MTQEQEKSLLSLYHKEEPYGDDDFIEAIGATTIELNSHSEVFLFCECLKKFPEHIVSWILTDIEIVAPEHIFIQPKGEKE